MDSDGEYDFDDNLDDGRRLECPVVHKTIIASRLGHTQLSTTNRYVHALRDSDEAAVQTFETLIAPTEDKEKKQA